MNLLSRQWALGGLVAIATALLGGIALVAYGLSGGYCGDLEQVIPKSACHDLSRYEQSLLRDYLTLRELRERFQLLEPRSVAPAVRTSDTTISIFLEAEDVEPAR